MNFPPLHPNLSRLGCLIGTWRGKGKGIYPTIKTFEYVEEIQFWHIGKPFLFYAQKTWNLENGMPLHSEMGYIRAPSVDKVELILTQPTGLASVEEGTVSENNVISLVCTKLERSSTAKHPWVSKYNRVFEVKGSSIHYTLDMETENQPLQRHLEATLEKAV